MSIDGNFFWFLMGILFIVVAYGFKLFAEDKKWTITWWKAALCIAWYSMFTLNLYAGGILIGESESGAGVKMMLAGLVVCLITGVGLYRLLLLNPSKS